MKIGFVTTAGFDIGQRSAERRIRDLAAKHRVKPVRAKLDAWAADVSRLSDAETGADEIADLVVALKRAGILKAKEAADLYGDYLAER